MDGDNELARQVEILKRRIAALEEEFANGKKDRRKIREALTRLMRQEKAARGQINLDEIINILRDEGDE